MATRAYFYKDEQGNLKRNIYCSMCQAGPFKEEERDKYKEYNMRYSVYYCTRCVTNLRLKNPVVQYYEPKNIEPEKILIEEIETALINKTEIVAPIIKAPEEVHATKSKAKPPKKKTEPKYSLPDSKETPIKKGVNGTSYVYMLECSDSTLLPGMTKDLEGAVNSDQVDGKKLPAELVFYKSFKSSTEADDYLKSLKTRSRTAKSSLVKNFEKSYLNRTF